MKPNLDSGSSTNVSTSGPSDVPRDHIRMRKFPPQGEYSFESFSSSHLPFYKRFLLCMGLDRLAGTGMRLSVDTNDDIPLLTEYNDSYA